MKRWTQMVAVALMAAMIGIMAIGYPGMAAEAPGNSEEQDKPESEMTEEEKAEKEAKEAHERALKEAYELPVQTNKIKNWPKGPGTYGDAGIVMDADSGAILYAKNIDKHEYPASITKVLTALLAFQYGDMTSRVTISEEALSCLGSGYASIGLKPGNEITLEQAVYAMLLASANETAYAVGENIAESQGHEYDWFIEQMNEKCASLGGNNSNFINTNGVFDENHYTCARDMALIGKALFEYPMFFQICQTQQYTIPESDTVEEHIFQQKHRMLLQDNEDYYEYAIGGKTGYTTEAENTLITLADNGEKRLICVVLRTYGGHPYSDTKALLDYGFDNFHKVFIQENDVEEDYRRIDSGAYVMLPEKVEFEKLEREIVFHEDGTDDATVTYFYKDMPVGTCEVTVSGNYYNRERAAEKELEMKEKAEQKSKKEAAEKAKEKKKEKEERYKAVAAIGVAGILAVCAAIAGVVTNISRKRKEKRRRR
ncbi:MAG: D-alanyl-D-alanine carboxypeptidase [Dorea sp.]|jgi:D-alanyl-D-alanine carboxypeptidase (penicillin-binding protein 5/6)|nr:D-alanyl-D-alanine carboxypeptidase [Dorea sp.]